MFSLICVWINGWANNSEAGDLRRYRAHYDVIVMRGPFYFIFYHELCLVPAWISEYIYYRNVLCNYLSVLQISTVQPMRPGNHMGLYTIYYTYLFGGCIILHCLACLLHEGATYRAHFTKESLVTVNLDLFEITFRCTSDPSHPNPGKCFTFHGRYCDGFLLYLSCSIFTSWWRHQMETFSVLLAFCEGNSPVRWIPLT